MDDAEFGRTIHRRLLDADPVASEDLCARWLEPLVGELARAFPAVARRDYALIEDAVVDSLLNYVERPAIYQPERSPLRKFLYFAARRDLQNALAALHRRDAREPRLSVVEVSSRPRNVLQVADESGPGIAEVVVDDAEQREYWRVLAPHFPDERDRRLLALYLQGERKTEPYAAVLGIGHLAFAGQQREVKRHKDRIGKRLRRLGEKLREQRQA